MGIRLRSKRRAGGVRQGLLLHRVDQPDYQCEQLLVTACSKEPPERTETPLVGNTEGSKGPNPSEIYLLLVPRHTARPRVEFPRPNPSFPAGLQTPAWLFSSLHGIPTMFLFADLQWAREGNFSATFSCFCFLILSNIVTLRPVVWLPTRN